MKHILLYHNTVISYLNIDIRITEKISWFTDASVNHCSPNVQVSVVLRRTVPYFL